MSRSNRIWAFSKAGIRATAILVFLSTNTPSYVEAQIVSPAGRTLFNDGVLIRSVLRYDTFEEERSGEEFSRLRNTYAVVWGARPHLSLSVATPILHTEATSANPTRRETTRTGTGDTSVFARYDAFRRTVPGGYTRLAPEVGLKLPTGGAFGTGSTDVIAGLVYSHVRDPNWWIADVQMTLPGTGDGRFRAGDRRRFDLAYLRRVRPRDGMGIPMVLLALELNVESAERSEQAGVTLPESGGDLVYLSPGIEWVANRRLVLEASLPIVVSENLNGSAPKPRNSLVLGVRWLF